MSFQLQPKDIILVYDMSTIKIKELLDLCEDTNSILKITANVISALSIIIRIQSGIKIELFLEQ